jgi:hypothetical protein
VTQFPTYHDLVAANIFSPDDLTAILEYCDSNYDYVAIATPPGAGREHFAAVAEAYRAAEARGAVRVGTAMAFPRAALRLDGTPARPRKTTRIAPPDGLRTPAEAAAKLGCSIKTLNAHVAAGDLRYVIIGKGKKRVRRMYADADLDEFIANQTRKAMPCPSAATRGRHSGNTASKSEIVSFSEVQRRRRSAKPKR